MTTMVRTRPPTLRVVADQRDVARARRRRLLWHIALGIAWGVVVAILAAVVS